MSPGGAGTDDAERRSRPAKQPADAGRGEKIANEAGAGRFEKPALDAMAAPPEAHESLISRKTVEEVPLTGLSLNARDVVVEGNRCVRPDGSELPGAVVEE
jgi:hypothetical protein